MYSDFELVQYMCLLKLTYTKYCVFFLNDGIISIREPDMTFNENWKQVIKDFFISNGAPDDAYTNWVIGIIEASILTYPGEKQSYRFGFGNCL